MKEEKKRPRQDEERPHAGEPSAARGRRGKPEALAGAAFPGKRPEEVPQSSEKASVAARRPTAAELALHESLSRFESALQLFNRNQFAKARSLFERLTGNPARELAERARVYLNICDQRLPHTAPQLKTAEDLYNYAVRLANGGNPEEAEQHLRKALKLSPDSDYIYYALATTYAQRDDVEGALENLLKAIELNERNRYQAQNDADFANLLEDPRFTELLYPEKPVA